MPQKSAAFIRKTCHCSFSIGLYRLLCAQQIRYFLNLYAARLKSRYVAFSSIGSIGRTVGSGGVTVSFIIALWVNVNYYVNMSISEIRKDLDNLKNSSNSLAAPDIDLKKVPKPLEPALNTPDQEDRAFHGITSGHPQINGQDRSCPASRWLGLRSRGGRSFVVPPS